MDLEKGEARAASNWIYITRNADGVLVGSAGRYDDTLVKGADGQWRISIHRVTPLPKERQLYKHKA